MSVPDPLATGSPALEALLEHLKRTRGFDFTGYKRASLTRRIAKRMQLLGADDYADYLRHLETHSDEFAQLFNTILINVTSFFRDEASWEYLRDEVVPRIVAGKDPNEPIRVWSAGCATGEEAYSLAMAFAEVLPPHTRDRLKVYATDVDDEALAVARQGVYGERALESVPEPLREKYFDRQDGRYAFRKEVRRYVIFGRNDLIQDAPISRIDLLVCRNTLMYFDADTQAKVLSRFHFALRDEGYLFLGRAETMLSHVTSFAAVDLQRRIFLKVPRSAVRDRLALVPRLAADAPAEGVPVPDQLRDAALDLAPVAQLVVDRAGALVLANDRARILFRLASADLGRPLQDLELSYRPIELRSRIQEAFTDRRPQTIRDVEWRQGPNADPRWFDVVVTPMRADTLEMIGVSVTFTDVTNTRQLQRELEQSHQELESAYEELQSTNEELETTNEELQSTVEELETTNEELQSTNEELETMNEELQSTNEELQTINDELRRRGDELNDVNGFLESVFASLRTGVVVLDGNLRVLVWNPQAEDLWGLRADEVEGSSFLALDIGLPLAPLRAPVQTCLAGETPEFEQVLDATNRRGRSIACRVTGVPLLRRQDGLPAGVILFMDARGD